VTLEKVRSVSRFEDWAQAVADLLDAFMSLSSATTDHGTTLGTAREVFVSHVLRRLLPESVHIGSGEAVDRHGCHSKQLDVVVYRPDMPRLSSLAETNLYFAEGVIAGVEVKSSLTKERLDSALSNSLSLKKLYSNDTGLNGWNLSKAVPATYIFGYRGYKTRTDCVRAVLREWAESSAVEEMWQLPDVMATRGLVVIKNDDAVIKYNLLRHKFSPMSLFLARRDENPLRWILHHLLQKLGRSGLASPSINHLLGQSVDTCKELIEEAEAWGVYDPDGSRGEIAELP
jgi:uncharacterized protein DUF6602